jgi:hypothetical protein
MDGMQPLGVYFLSCVLYTIPVLFLLAAWNADTRNRHETVLPRWRRDCLKAALLAASIATGLSVIFIFSYLNNGGGIHGSTPSHGLWQVLGPVSDGVGAVSLVLAALGKGKGRVKLFGWALGTVVAVVITFGIAMD